MEREKQNKIHIYIQTYFSFSPYFSFAHTFIVNVKFTLRDRGSKNAENRVKSKRKRIKLIRRESVQLD